MQGNIKKHIGDYCDVQDILKGSKKRGEQAGRLSGVLSDN